MQWSTYPRLGLTGVLFADMASLISSNFLATKFPADFRVLSPPRSSSFLLVKLLGLKTKLAVKWQITPTQSCKDDITVSTCHNEATTVHSSPIIMSS